METGEEWALNGAVLNSSYPTYEEWKPLLLFNSSNLYPRSYPTYEEWKQTHSAYNFDW